VEKASGIRVVQDALYARLQHQGFDVRVLPSRYAGRSLIQRFRGLVVGLLAGARSGEVLLNVVNPFPLLSTKRSVVIVHDLQWRVTKPFLGRMYHRLDLAWSLLRSSRVVVISDRVREEVVAFMPRVGSKVVVGHLGPGLVQDPALARQHAKTNTVLLIGRASHKRNDLAAQVIASLPSDFIDGVVGVGLDDLTKGVLEQALGAERCTWLTQLTDTDMVTAIATSRYFLHLGMLEGFGLPYIEALTAGAIVVAIDQPLTRQLLGEAAILLPDSNPVELAELWTRSPEPDVVTRYSRADRYDWDRFAATVGAAVRQAANQ
jgi:hypothetical protein